MHLSSEDHSVAAQMKLLAESPEKIWLCLEGQEYLPAAHHYLLSRHIFSQLSVKLGRGNNRDFTLIQRLWHSVACFKENILEVNHALSITEGVVNYWVVSGSEDCFSSVFKVFVGGTGHRRYIFSRLNHPLVDSDLLFFRLILIFSVSMFAIICQALIYYVITCWISVPVL